MNSGLGFKFIMWPFNTDFGFQVQNGRKQIKQIYEISSDTSAKRFDFDFDQFAKLESCDINYSNH